MDALTRAETVSILAAMNVELPARTKLPDKALQKRLRDSLEAAQYMADEITDAMRPLNPPTLRAWSGPVLEASRRGNLNEAVRNYTARQNGRENDVDLFQDPFTDLRYRYTVTQLVHSPLVDRILGRQLWLSLTIGTGGSNALFCSPKKARNRSLQSTFV